MNYGLFLLLSMMTDVINLSYSSIYTDMYFISLNVTYPWVVSLNHTLTLCLTLELGKPYLWSTFQKLLFFTYTGLFSYHISLLVTEDVALSTAPKPSLELKPSQITKTNFDWDANWNHQTCPGLSYLLLRLPLKCAKQKSAKARLLLWCFIAPIS